MKSTNRTNQPTNVVLFPRGIEEIRRELIKVVCSGDLAAMRGMVAGLGLGTRCEEASREEIRRELIKVVCSGDLAAMRGMALGLLLNAR